MKARVYLLGLVLLCSACTAPSLRYKKEVQSLLASQKMEEAQARVEQAKEKHYSERDASLFYLDKALVLHDSHQPYESDILFSSAQQHINENTAKSISGTAGTLLINDLTAPYTVASYEQALTFFFRAMNFLEQNKISSAAVEARKAVFFLDHLRGSKSSGYNDDPFVQYFASLIFESEGNLSSARIARTNSLKAYERLGKDLKVSAPEFYVPQDAQDWGEIILFHYNGLLPLKKTATFMLSWNELVSYASYPEEGYGVVAPEVHNAILTAMVGRSAGISAPILEQTPYQVSTSWAEANGQRYYTQKVADFAAAAHLDLQEKRPGILFRSATRAVVKQVASVQAGRAMTEATGDEGIGELARLLVNIFGAVTEKADTRQWFTLPAEVRMTRIFVAPGNQNIRLLFSDGYGNIIGEHTFENVFVPKGGRVFLHHRTAY